MKLWCLGGYKDASCVVVDFSECRLMVDCGAEQLSLLRFLPSLATTATTTTTATATTILKDDHRTRFLDTACRLHSASLSSVEISSIDAVLLTSATSSLALPFLTERFGFRGRILATDPVAFTLKRLLTELAVHSSDSCREDTFRECGAFEDEVDEWHSLPTAEEVASCMERVTSVHFGERVDILGDVTVTPASAGIDIGSAYWVATTPMEKVAIVSEVSCVQHRHPIPFDETSLRGADAVVLASQLPPSEQQRTYEQCAQDLVASVTATVSGGGSVLIPCSPGGVMFDAIEYINSQLGGVRVPVFVVSPAAHDMFQLSVVSAEWLCQSRAERVFAPSELFVHTQLINAGTLKYFASASGNVGAAGAPNQSLGAVFREPCVMFVSHPSCRLGDVPHFIELFGANAKNLIVLVDPRYSDPSVLLPFGALACRVQSCPLDARANQQKIGEVLARASVNLVVHCSHSVPICNVPMKFLPHLGETEIPINRTFVKATISPALASTLRVRPAGDGVQIAELSCRASIRDGLCTLLPDESTGRAQRHQPQQSQHQQQMRPPSLLDGPLWGYPQAQSIVLALSEIGAGDIEVIGSADGGLVVRGGISGSTVAVSVYSGETTILADSDALRERAACAVVKNCLRTFNN